MQRRAALAGTAVAALPTAAIARVIPGAGCFPWRRMKDRGAITGSGSPTAVRR
nr:hypothetical protein [Streptomyces sp. NRRL S-118]